MNPYSSRDFLSPPCPKCGDHPELLRTDTRIVRLSFQLFCNSCRRQTYWKEETSHARRQWAQDILLKPLDDLRDFASRRNRREQQARRWRKLFAHLKAHVLRDLSRPFNYGLKMLWVRCQRQDGVRK